MQSTFRFSNVEILAVKTTSLIYNFWHLRTADHILVGKKKGLNAGVVNYNINDVLSRQQNKAKNPTSTVPRKETILALLYLGVRSKIVTKQLKTCINKFYGCIDLGVIFQSARRIKSFFPYKDMINRSQMSKVVYKASCWDCQDLFFKSALLILTVPILYINHTQPTIARFAATKG